ncbi:MAG: DnaD domain protein [Bacilli bacterium]|nr:DnaD domain protein [Bacilli bacterium]
MNKITNVVNFTYLLVEFYKVLGLSENELAVILVIEHLSQQENDLITAPMISLKMNLSEKEIDEILAKLYTAKMLEIETRGNRTLTSLKPLQDMVYKAFQRSIFSEEEIEKDRELDEVRRRVLAEMEKLLNRTLSPIEVDRVNSWITEGVSEDIIMNSILDAKAKNQTSINNVDRYILYRMRREDKSGNELK